MPKKSPLATLILFLGSVLFFSQLHAQPCPEVMLQPTEASNYLEIRASDSENIRIPIPEVRVFPGGKERIYLLLPDIVTSLATPIIQWNELVLKKPLNSTANWQGSLDRAAFFDTSCLPRLEAGNFGDARSEDNFLYVTENNRVTVKGTVSFAEMDGRQLLLHLDVAGQEIPSPLINDLDGELYVKNDSLTITSGEISYFPNEFRLVGAGFAEGKSLNQRFEFEVSGYTGLPGVFVVNEGTEGQDAFFIYRIAGEPDKEITVKKYAPGAGMLASDSFFEPIPIQIDALDFDELALLGTYHSTAVLIDPKPVAIELPLQNQAFKGISPDIRQVKSFSEPLLLSPETWENDVTLFVENLPVWNLQWNELTDPEEGIKKITLQRRTEEENREEPEIRQRLSYQQVERINEGFMEIFETFDETKDTLSLKTSILALFDENKLATTATEADSFEDFLVTTVSAFREAEKYALYTSSGESVPALDANAIALLPVALQVDQETGLPLSRSFSYKTTRIQIDYESDSILLTLTNERQGTQRLTVPNAALLDIYQFFGILTQLPLASKYQANLGFFDLMPVEKSHFGVPGSERVLATPTYVHTRIRVVDELTYQGTPAFKLDVQFNGLSNPFFAESYEEDFTGTYYVTQSFPHTIIKATFNQGLTLQSE